MIRNAASKVMWVGRAAVFLVGLAVILALVFGVVSRALAHSGVDAKLFHLAHNNVATALTKLTGTLTAPVLKVDNNGNGPALSLEVGNQSVPANNVAPMKVNSNKVVTNLNADKLDGKEPDQLPGTIAAIATFAGYSGTSIPATPLGWTFVGPTATVTTTSTQKLVGSGAVPLGLSSGGPQILRYDLCYQPSSGGTITNLSGENYSSGELTTTLVSWAVATTHEPGAGTWKVGFCVSTSGPSAIDETSYVNGWVQVVNH